MEAWQCQKADSFWSASGWAKRRASSGSASITIARMDTNFNAAEQRKNHNYNFHRIQFSVVRASENPIFRGFLRGACQEI
jgi:DNA-binding FadR family transcriptional regulator